MLNRVILVVLAAFWLTMSCLLWRSEVRGKYQTGTEIPVEVVWEKILTSPDNSNLEVRRRTKRIGFIRWSASVGDDYATGRRSDLNAPSGMVRGFSNYTLDADGSFLTADKGKQFKFYTNFRFATNFDWEEFSVRLSQRPFSAGIRADAKMATAMLTVSDGTTDWEQTVTLAELHDPKKLATKFGGPLLGNAMGAILDEGVARARSASSHIKWQAHEDWLKVGYAQLRVYRVHAQLSEDQEIVIYVSRVGEILKAELPNQVTLVNDELGL